MLKNAKNSTFLDRFISLDSIGEYLLNTVSENSTFQEHQNNIHFIGCCCGEKKKIFTFRPLTTPMDHLKYGRA
jgi:hypothetical protein